MCHLGRAFFSGKIIESVQTGVGGSSQRPIPERNDSLKFYFCLLNLIVFQHFHESFINLNGTEHK